MNVNLSAPRCLVYFEQYNEGVCLNTSGFSHTFSIQRGVTQLDVAPYLALVNWRLVPCILTIKTYF